MANFTDKTKLIPTYIEGDYNTSLSKFYDLLKQDETFKDFNYHGSNIAMITELMAYLADFSNFYTNLVAKNVYIDTADVYETVHRLVTQKGYIPLGYLSSEVNVSVTVEHPDINKNVNSVGGYDTLVIDAWQTVDSGAVSTDGDAIYYTLTEQQTITPDGIGIASFDIPMRQGTVDEVVYSGQDIIDNQIVLPFRQYDTGMYPFDVRSIQVIVNDREWIRVHDFYDHISGLIPDERNVYTFYYDKYERYVVSFASSFDVPNPSDIITIRMLRSFGIDGIIGANTMSVAGIGDFTVQNISSSEDAVILTSDDITLFKNIESSIGGSNPETTRELKSNADANMHTQFRNVTGLDYKFHIEMRSDIIRATAWGENEVDPSNTIEYNKVYVSTIPRDGNTSSWINGVFNTTDITWVDTDIPTLSADIEIPTDYWTSFENDLLQYLEPRKMISVYEFPVVPQGIFFRFDIGLRVNRSYKYMDVKETVKAKLIYFFDSINREFAEEVNFMDLHNFIYDMSVHNEDEYYLQIKGLDNLVIRDIGTYTIVPAPSGVVPVSCGNWIVDSTTASSSGHWDYTMCSLDKYLSGSDYNDYIQDAKLAMGTITSTPLSGWTGYYDVFEPNDTQNYPQYTQIAKEGYYDNKLRPIQLGYNQYPMLSIEMCRFFNESI